MEQTVQKKIDYSEIIRMFENKTPINEIARVTGYSKTTIIKQLKLNNVYEYRFPLVDSNQIIDRYVKKIQSVKTIAKEMNISKNSVLNTLHKNNIKLRYNSCNAPIEEIINLYNQGKLIFQIATIYNISENTLSKILKKAGVDIKNHIKSKSLNCDEVVEYHKKNNELLIKTASHFNVSTETIKKLLIRSGYKNFRKKVWNRSFDNELVEMYNKNYSSSDIAKYFGFCHTTILRHLKRLGVKIKKIYVEAKRSSGYKLINGSHFNSIKSSAQIRCLKFEVSKEQIYDLFLIQKCKCKISGVELTMPENNNDYITGNFTASLDRIDSNKGYTIDNIQWVHKKINIMKQNMTDQEFINWCKIISDFNKS